jgi:hypothetical protein
MSLSHTIAPVLVLFGAVSLSFAQDQKPSFSLIISTPKSTVPVGSEVRLDITVTNISDHDVALTWSSPSELIYGFDIRDSKGRSPAETERLRWVRGKVAKTASGKTVELDSSGKPKERGEIGEPLFGVPGAAIQGSVYKPGHGHSESIVLNRMYDLSQPGDYTIQLSKKDSATKTVVKSNIVTVTITAAE